jgi:hypothetical protein
MHLVLSLFILYPDTHCVQVEAVVHVRQLDIQLEHVIVFVSGLARVKYPSLHDVQLLMSDVMQFVQPVAH